jgi:signal transduction histidine kinase
MALTVLLLLAAFAWTEYKTNKENITLKLNSEAKRISRNFNDIMDHTSFIMKVMAMQIQSNHKDTKHISDILYKYSMNQKLHSSISSSVFAWLNSDNIKVVDSISGNAITPTNLSNREYIKAARNFPNTLHLYTPTFGFISQRYTIPAILGVTHNKNYIGAITVGFDLVNLSAILSDSINDHKIYFALLDKNLDIILQSQNNFTPNKTRPISSQDLQDFIESRNITIDNLTTVSDIDLLFTGQNHYLYKLPNHQFVIYLRYDDNMVTQNFWQDITYRVIEVVCIALIASILLTITYRREKKLRTRAEQATELAIKASKAKTDFLAYTAHELRSPLSFIISSSELMTKQAFGALNDKYISYIKNINQNSKDLLDFIDDLIDSMKLEYVDFSIKEEEVNIENLLRRSIKTNNAIYDNKIFIETRFSSSTPLLRSDPKRLLQIFNNIISNAIKYSPSQTTLTISSTTSSKGLHIAFSDQGHGMNQKEIEDSINKLKFTTNTKQDKESKANSIGLGLPLIKHLLSLMKGTLEIESHIGKGTKITISFAKEKIIHKDNTKD